MGRSEKRNNGLFVRGGQEEEQREMQSSVGGSCCKNEMPAAFQATRPHGRHGQEAAGHQVGQEVQVRGGLTTCPPGLQLQLHQASIGRVQASQSSS